MHLYIAIAIALIIPVLCLVIIVLQHTRQEDERIAHLLDHRKKPPVVDLRASAHTPKTPLIYAEHGTSGLRDKRAKDALDWEIYCQKFDAPFKG